jgi:ArsR family transcriptional regulator
MRENAYLAPRRKGSVDGARFLRLLSDEIRLRILTLLLKTPDLCVCELVAVLRLPQYRISRHLGPLRRSGLLRTRREGPFVFYSIAETARRDPVQGLVLRSVPALARREVAAGDLGRMSRLMKLESGQRASACATVATPRALRARPILRALPTP